MITLPDIVLGSHQTLIANVTPTGIEDAVKKLHSSSNQLVKRECLMYLAQRVQIKEASVIQYASSEIITDSSTVVKILRDYSNHHDSRVRSAALAGLVSGQ